MKRARIGVIAAAVLAVATMAFAQTPDFSGTWTPDPAASGAPAGGTGGTGTGGTGTGGGGMRGAGGPMTVKHQGSTLTIERQGREGATQTVTYKLDGSETEIPMGQGTAKATAKIDGGKLVIVTKTEQGENTQTWTLNGGVLTIERAGARGTSKTVYKKGA
jgi:hypothetical protein